jgi:hypothetical protein
MANFLSYTRVGDFIRPKVIASLTPNDTIETILQVKYNIQGFSSPSPPSHATTHYAIAGVEH